MIDSFKDMIGQIIDFMETHTDPFFHLPFLTCAVGLGVITLISDFFVNGGLDDEYSELDENDDSDEW